MENIDSYSGNKLMNSSEYNWKNVAYVVYKMYKLWSRFGIDLGMIWEIRYILITRTHDYMIKVLTTHEIGKQHDNKQQHDQRLEKIARRVSAFKSNLSLAVIIGSMISLDLAFILLLMRWTEVKWILMSQKKGVRNEKWVRL